MKKVTFFTLLFVAILTLSGCLTAEKKTYEFKLNSDNSGTLTITYYNIYSQLYEDEDVDSVLNSDYQELIDSYLQGSEIESEFPNVTVKSKKLFKKDDVLCGKLVLEFDDPNDVHLFKFDDNSPWMYLVPSDETLETSNGVVAADYLPIVFWTNNTKSPFTFETSISEPQDIDVSLADTWKNNKVKWDKDSDD